MHGLYTLDGRGESRSNDTHRSTTDPESRLYRKCHAAPALQSSLGHVLTDNHDGQMVNVQASTADGMAECDMAVQMPAEVTSPAPLPPPPSPSPPPPPPPSPDRTPEPVREPPHPVRPGPVREPPAQTTFGRAAAQPGPATPSALAVFMQI